MPALGSATIFLTALVGGFDTSTARLVSLDELGTRYLLYDYVTWEQFSKQKRGLYWALQTARASGRTLVLPKARFHTERQDKYEYYPFSLFYDLHQLAQMHPVIEMDDFLDREGGSVDVIFSLRRGVAPKDAVEAAGGSAAEWVPAQCSAEIIQDCRIGDDGNEVCAASVIFAGEDVSTKTLKCGWAPRMRWINLIRGAANARSIGIGGVVYQVPPSGLRALQSQQRALSGGGDGCGWRCPYEAMRARLRPRDALLTEARRFIEQIQANVSGSAAGTSEQQRRSPDDLAATPPAVLAVHWRRGDFLKHKFNALDRVCVNEATGAPLAQCLSLPVLRSPEELAEIIKLKMAEFNCSAVFLASNANEMERAQLEAALGFRPFMYAPSETSDLKSRGMMVMLDTLICAVAHAFIGTRQSMFTFNILEERVMQQQELATGSYM